MKCLFRVVTLVSMVFLMGACSTSLSYLKADPAPNSGFLGEASSEATANENYPFHRVWHPESGRKALNAPRKMYVAPVNTAHLQEENIASNKDAKKISKYMQKSFSSNLSKLASDHFMVVDQAEENTVILELALVELKPTDVARNVLGTVVGTIVPGGSLLSIDGQGTIAIEGRLRDSTTGEVLFVFADRESGKMAPLNLNDFSLYSHARDIIDDWARQLTEVLCASGTVRVADTSPVTLLPI